MLNDEAHHVANESGKTSKKWQEFLHDPDYGFRFVVGVSGTCYVGDDYFADVVHRYAKRFPLAKCEEIVKASLKRALRHSTSPRFFRRARDSAARRRDYPFARS